MNTTAPFDLDAAFDTGKPQGLLYDLHFIVRRRMQRKRIWGSWKEIKRVTVNAGDRIDRSTVVSLIHAIGSVRRGYRSQVRLLMNNNGTIVDVTPGILNLFGQHYCSPGQPEPEPIWRPDDIPGDYLGEAEELGLSI